MNKILGKRGIHSRSRLILCVMSIYVIFACSINIVYCTSPDEFMDEIHDENHPEAKIIGHRDTGNTTKTCPNFDVKTWVKDKLT